MLSSPFALCRYVRNLRTHVSDSRPAFGTIAGNMPHMKYKMHTLRGFAIAVACAAFSLAGCGGGDGGPPPPPPAVTTQILSDPGFDGDIQQTSPISFTVTQGMSPTVQTVFAGIDP